MKHYDDDLILEMYKNGAKYEEIKAKIGCSNGYIGNLAKKHNISRSLQPKSMKHHGYILVLDKENPMADKKGYVPLHRLVYSEFLGRALSPDEIIHHINGNKEDNRLENLQLVTIGEHRTIHNNEKEYKHKFDTKLVEELYKQGYSSRKIEELTGISKSAVIKYLKEKGLSRKREETLSRNKEGKFIKKE